MILTSLQYKKDTKIISFYIIIMNNLKLKWKAIPFTIVLKCKILKYKSDKLCAGPIHWKL